LALDVMEHLGHRCPEAPQTNGEMLRMKEVEHRQHQEILQLREEMKHMKNVFIGNHADNILLLRLERVV
jgi:hypothetical protein